MNRQHYAAEAWYHQSIGGEMFSPFPVVVGVPGGYNKIYKEFDLRQQNMQRRTRLKKDLK